MTRVLFGLSLLLATCLVDGVGVAFTQADTFDTPSIIDFDSDYDQPFDNDDGEQIAQGDTPELLFEYFRAPSPPGPEPGYRTEVSRSYQIRAPPDLR